MKTLRAVILGFVVLSQFPTGSARAVDVPQEKLNELLKRIDELEKKVKALEESKTNAPPAVMNGNTVVTNANVGVTEPLATPPGTGPLVSLGNQGLLVRTSDSNFVLNLHGFMQGDARFYFGEKTVPDTFLLRRVRPILEGTVYDIFDYRLQLDFASDVNSPGTNNNGFVTDAYINARLLTNLQVQLGKYKPPIGLEREQTTANLQFVETGLPTQFVPNYDLGAMIHNGLFDHSVDYAIGIFNGVADGGSDDIESSDEGKEMVGRIYAQPFLRTDVLPLRGLGFGAGASYGYRAGATRAYTTQGQQTFFAYGNAANSVTYSGNQYRIDPQGYYYWGPFGIYGEYVVDSAALRDATTSGINTGHFYNTAWQVIGSYIVTGENNSFGPIMPQDPVRGLHTGWGAVELVVRVGQMTMDRNLFPAYASTISGREQTSWGTGVNWHLNRNVKLQLDYESTTFHDASFASGSATARPEHVILSRAQLSF